MNSTCILIGVGGSGGYLIRHISSYAAASGLRDAPQTLTIDTDLESNTLHTSHFSLGGFQLRPAIDTLPPDTFPPENMEALRSLDLSVNMGAAARADIGRVAYEMHRARLEKWLTTRISESISNSTRTLRIIVVGSICGGTGAGVIPELGNLIRLVLKRVRIPGVIIGFGLGVSVFGRTIYHALTRSLSHNEDYSLKRLFNKISGDEPSGFDDFYVADASPGSGLELQEVIEAFARRIVAGWILEHSSSESSSISSSSAAKNLGDSAGVILLTISGFDKPDVDLLWTPGNQLGKQSITTGSPSLAEPAFYLPRFRNYWSSLINQFRALISKDGVTEIEIQGFLESNPTFITGFDYERAVPHVYLSNSRKGDLIPDFLLIPFGSHLADILELKRPSHRLIVSQSGHSRISACLLHAMVQLRDYEEYFDCEENRERIHTLYGFTAYKPKLHVVIGTRSGIESELTFRKVTSDHPGLNVITYDDILDRASRWLY